MRTTARLVCAAVVLALVPIAVSAQESWKGSYSFYEDGSKNAGGIAVLISHELEVFEGDSGLNASIESIESNGYQTSADLICTTKVEGAKLLVIFQSYGDYNMFEPYEQGDVLLTLERKTEKGKTLIVTHWGKFKPAFEKNQKSGKVYFEKSASPK